jgi:hypothetical protein
MCSNKVYAGIYSALLLLVSVSYVAADNTVWDYAPDFSKDSFPPYPDLKNPDGSNITVQNLRGVHLFGWKAAIVQKVRASWKLTMISTKWHNWPSYTTTSTGRIKLPENSGVHP